MDEPVDGELSITKPKPLKLTTYTKFQPHATSSSPLGLSILPVFACTAVGRRGTKVLTFLFHFRKRERQCHSILKQTKTERE